MTDHQKAVCYDTLKEQLELAQMPITGTALLKTMNNMEKAMRFTNTIVQPTITAEIIDGKPGHRG